LKRRCTVKLVNEFRTSIVSDHFFYHTCDGFYCVSCLIFLFFRRVLDASHNSGEHSQHTP
jgi:hypothetical protein